MDMRRLAAIPLFSTLPEADLVAAVANELEIGEGDTLTTEDEFGHCLFAIGAGTAEVIRDGATLRMVGAGELIGEVAVLTSGRRTATIVATTPLRPVSLFKRDVWTLERDAPEAARRRRELLATRTIAPAP
jgi:CPA1 family monovalent cation:H+ antiporter